MDILKIYQAAYNRLGVKEVAQSLDIPEGMASMFFKRIKTPGGKTCQKIIDLWGEVAPEPPDGSDMKVWSEESTLNCIYTPPEWGQKKKAWNGRDICLCLPVVDEFPQATTFCLLSAIAKYRQGVIVNLRGDDSMITRSRNQLALRFLRDTTATWSIWIDSDMVFPMGHAGVYKTLTGMNNLAHKFLGMHTFERLISHGKTVVGGCYWDRRGSGKLIAGGGGAIMKPIPSDTLHAIGFVGTGCLAVHRQVFLDIAAKFPETMSPTSHGNECGFFTNIQTPERMLGEDESFAKRATDSGHPSYLDLGLILGHVGTSHIHGMPNHGSRI